MCVRLKNREAGKSPGSDERILQRADWTARSRPTSLHHRWQRQDPPGSAAQLLAPLPPLRPVSSHLHFATNWPSRCQKAEAVPSAKSRRARTRRFLAITVRALKPEARASRPLYVSYVRGLPETMTIGVVPFDIIIFWCPRAVHERHANVHGNDVPGRSFLGHRDHFYTRFSRLPTTLHLAIPSRGSRREAVASVAGSRRQ